MDPWGRLVVSYLRTDGLTNCHVFLLVAARLTGLFLVAPAGLKPFLPYTARFGLVVLCSLIIAPTLAANEGFDGNVLQVGASSESFHNRPETTPELMHGIIHELALGWLLGMGVLAIMSGLQLGGEWLDRHGGLGIGSILNPECTGAESGGRSLAQLLGIATLLLLEPWGGHGQVLRAVLQTFQSIPLGSSEWSLSSAELLSRLVQQSMILGLRVAMPLVVTMMLVEMTLAFAGRGTVSLVSSAQQPLRAVVGLAVLGLTLTALPEAIAASMISLLEVVRGH